MTDKELKRLSRTELLEMLIEQGKEVERLKKELEDTQKQLENRQLAIDSSGSIAEAALKLNGVFEAAQSSADLYLENIENMVSQTKEECDRIIAEAQKKADKIASGEEL